MVRREGCRVRLFTRGGMTLGRSLPGHRRGRQCDQGAIIPDDVPTTPHFLVWDNYFSRGPRFAPEPIWPPLPAFLLGGFDR